MLGISRRSLLGAVSAAVVCAESALAQQPGTRNIDDFFRDFTLDWLRHNPGTATATRYLQGAEQDELERHLTPLGPRQRAEQAQRARRALEQLRTFNRASLTDERRLSADLLDWQLNNIIRAEAFADYAFPLQQMNGANVDLVEVLTVRHPLANERDAENYVAALGEVAARMDEAIAEAKRLESKNVRPPKFILEATVRQMQRFADPSPAQNPFVTVLVEKMQSAQVPQAKSEQLRAEAEKIVGQQVYPAWKRAIAVLASQQPKATADAGLWRLRGGAEAYRFFLHFHTTTDLTPEQIHQIGLDQVAQIEARMDTLFKQLGRTEGTVAARIEKLKLDMQYPDPASTASREQIMRDIDAILRDALERSAALFDLRPKSPVVARPFPAFREGNAAANYNVPAADGSRPGTFQFPRRVEMMTKFGLRSIVYHETVPGHHFQLALQVENKALPIFRQLRIPGGAAAFSEGWGLYAERLAAESGWYENDTEGLLGQLNYELFRARRLVVDTGIHAMKWTRQQSIDYGIEASEVERYCVFPGQACSYMMGELKLVELREKAHKSLGEKFSIREYHNLVLRTGVVPLDLLEKQVDGWIARTKPPSSSAP
jgi:uncharacterized protein (DUF885 family)